LFKDGKYEESISKFQACLDLDPDNHNFHSTIYMNRAIAFTKLKKNELALQDLNDCIKAKDDYAKAYVKRGEVHLELENYAEAVRDFD
jgi:tetratricopeptide (TPR) repeat protein